LSSKAEEMSSSRWSPVELVFHAFPWIGKSMERWCRRQVYQWHRVSSTTSFRFGVSACALDHVPCGSSCIHVVWLSIRTGTGAPRGRITWCAGHGTSNLDWNITYKAMRNVLQHNYSTPVSKMVFLFGNKIFLKASSSPSLSKTGVFVIRASGASVLIGASLLCIALQEMVGCAFRSKRMA
jgi:hypothetical protein